MKRFIGIYLPIVILTLLCSLPFLFPARFIWSGINTRLQNSSSGDGAMVVSGLKIFLSEIDGSFWKGSAQITINDLPVGKVDWTMIASTFLAGEPGTILEFTGPFHRFDGLLSSNGEYVSIKALDGHIGAEAVTPWSSAYGLYPAGTLSLHNIGVEVQENWITGLSGDLSWDGGPIQYRNNKAKATYPLPPLHGLLSLDNSMAILNVKQSDGMLPVLETNLQVSGWGMVTIRRRFFDLSGKNWLATDSADDIALQIEQKLW